MEQTQRCGSCKDELPIEQFSPSYREKAGTWCRACFAAYNRGERGAAARHVSRRCAHCSAPYVPKQLKAAAAYCSRSCKDKAKNARLAAARLASKPADRRCIRCGGVMPREMRTDALFCSEQCSYKTHALPRSLRVNADQGDRIGSDRLAICERDGWKCGICGEPVDDNLRHPDPMCASLDHILPLSAGGTDDLSNLRLTHLLCNVRRRNALEAHASV